MSIYVATPSVYPGAAAQVWAQLKGVLVTVVWSGVGSFVIFKVVDLIVGLRAAPESESTGLDSPRMARRPTTADRNPAPQGAGIPPVGTFAFHILGRFRRALFCPGRRGSPAHG